jgi:hypothetical protein
MVWTGSGPVPLTDIASGAFKPSFGGMTNPQDFQLSLGQESETVPDQDFELSIEPEEENSYELSIRSIKAELKAWERFETGHIGKKSRPFETKAVPPAVASLVQGKLRSATTIDEVKSVFESVRQTLGRRKRTPVVEGSLVDLMREYESVLKPIMRETQEKVSSEKPL